MGHIQCLDRPARFRLNAAAFKAVLFLGTLFLVVYNGVNALTAMRGDVGVWAFEWENTIPFVPLFILPYMSLDLFFIAAPFVCRDAEERRVVVKRVAFSILAGGSCFLLIPLRLAFERPEAGGWIGSLFQTFKSIDKPHNLFPSLHVTLAIVLGDLYVSRIQKQWRPIAYAWIGLIVISTLFTKQHHAIDLAGGALLAAFAMSLFPATKISREVQRRSGHAGIYYATAAIVTLAMTYATLPWGALLLWPAAALAVAALGYFRLGPGIYAKSRGRIPWPTRIALAPLLIGQRLSLLYYRPRCTPWSELAPDVWIGRVLNDREAVSAVRSGVRAVLDLTAEFTETKIFREANYKNLPILDLTAPTPAQRSEAIQFIEQSRSSGVVYIHCKIGYSRTAAIAGAWLLATRRAHNADEAIRQIRQCRPAIVIRPETQESLEAQ